jgi:hypothetical protein
MFKSRIIPGLFILISLYSCRSANRENFASENAAEDVNKVISSTAAVENKTDTARKFVRTAEIKFRVKSVLNSTYDIENITRQQGGFVTYTNLTSNINMVSVVKVSADSSVESTYYTVTNEITLRVPNINLDTTLREISRNIIYLDYRTIKAQDVALQILSNRMEQNRSQKSGDRLAAAIEKGGKQKDITEAEQLLADKEEQRDKAKISNLSLNDQIEFSTVKLVIYQRESVKRQLLSNDKEIEDYKPGFGLKLLESLKFGWQILEAIVVFVIKLWAIILIGIICYIIYKRYFRE